MMLLTGMLLLGGAMAAKDAVPPDGGACERRAGGSDPAAENSAFCGSFNRCPSLNGLEPSRAADHGTGIALEWPQIR
jgi:hypothetical protein